MTKLTEHIVLPPLEDSVQSLYRQRFPADMLARRNAVWSVLCREWLNRYVPRSGAVLEIGAGYCEFINNIAARERAAVDLNPDTRRHAASGVEVYQVAAEQMLEVVATEHFDVVFMSNFLEHCRTRDQVLAVLRAAWSALKPGGCVLVLGPNFRVCYREYFDYFDHHLPLTEKAVAEALELASFRVDEVWARTLPFTFRSHLPNWPWLVRLYLKLPWAWSLFGAQFFVVGRK